MALVCRTLLLAEEARGLVVRPRPGGGPDQALVFTVDGGVHELEGGAAGVRYTLGPQLASVGSRASYPTYDPATNAVIFKAPGGDTISKVDASNRVTTVAGPTGGSENGAGQVADSADLSHFCSFAPDDEGGVWVVDEAQIRRLDTRSGAVTTLEGAKPPRGCWVHLAYAHGPAAAGTLWAVTYKTVCRVRTEGNDTRGRVEQVAGSWVEQFGVDGSGPAARFRWIAAVLPVSGGRLLIADGADLRCMDAGGAVSTLLRGCFSFENGAAQMALLPSGDLGVVMENRSLMLISGGGFAPGAQQLQPQTTLTDFLLSQLSLPAEEAGVPGGSGGSRASAHPGDVIVRVGDRSFPVQPAVLAAGSEYFARLLTPGGGFAERGAAGVTLPDADPAAFAHLLPYMYSTAMGVPRSPSQLLAVPPELLRPTAALARWLLMGGTVAALTERLAAAATPASVLSDLAWADAHGMTDLAERLRAFAVRKRKAVELDGLEEFIVRCPQQAAKLLRASMKAN